MKKSAADIVLALVLVALLVGGVVAVVYSFVKPEFEPAVALSGYSAYAVAVLTVVYVLTTRGQLRVMTRQLTEMQRDRELQAQPLPLPTQIRVVSNRPGFFRDPRESRSHVLIRHHVFVRIRNLGTSPAVSVDICAQLVVPGESNPVEWASASQRAEAIEEKCEFPSAEDKESSFLFPEDDDGLLLSAVLEANHKKLPMVVVKLLYRNALGACFRVARTYRVYPKQESVDVITQWLERLKVFPIRCKDDLDRLEEFTDRHDAGADELGAHLSEQVIDGLTDETIEYDVWPVPATDKVEPISVEQYVAEIEPLHYGVKIGPRHKCEHEPK